MGRRRARYRGHHGHSRKHDFAHALSSNFTSDDKPFFMRWWWRTWPSHSSAARAARGRTSAKQYADRHLQGTELGPGAAGLILLWANASTKPSGISAADVMSNKSALVLVSENRGRDAASNSSALDAFKHSIKVLAECQGNCSAAASVCAECVREDGHWSAECLEQFCHLFACLDQGQQSQPDQKHAADEALHAKF